MPRQFGKLDVSTTWRPCSRCPHRHAPTAGCPATGVWLVAAMCRSCMPRRYCSKHDAHVR